MKKRTKTELIYLQLPSPLLARIKRLANAWDASYQSLIKIFLAEKVEEELKANR